MPDQARSAPALASAELITIPEFARRTSLGTRTIARKVADGTIPSLKIGRSRRIDPARGMAALRGELPPPPPPRRGRPRVRQ